MRALFTVLLLVPLLAPAQGVELVTVVSHPALSEMSGLVRSTYPGLYWVHNDSGDSARIFAMSIDAEITPPRWYTSIYPDNTGNDWEGHVIDNAWHNDWEAAALDPEEKVLYVADVGNNDNARRDLGVYVIDEPNPEFVGKARARAFLPIRYPDQKKYPAEQWHFDCEAVFTDGGKLYFLTKHRQPNEPGKWEPGTKLYRLDTTHTDKDNVLTLIDEHPLVMLATGADVSPNGKYLAVSTYAALWIFPRPTEGDGWLSSEPKVLQFDRNLVKQNEAIAWESDESLLMTNENRDIFRIPLSAVGL